MMYVTNLFAEGNGKEINIEHPTWNQIKNTILALDGWELSLITLGKEYEDREREGDTKEFMSIAGGGENKLYVCTIYYYEGEYEEVVLCDLSKSWEETVEIVRVFPMFFPPAQCFNIDKVLVAAETYSRFGFRDKSLHWAYRSLTEFLKLEIIEVK